MKKILYSFTLGLIVFACADEDQTPKPSFSNNDYFPNTPGSTWAYTGAFEATMTVTEKTQNFDNRTFNEIVSVNALGTNSSYLYKANGEYYNRGFIQGVVGVDLLLLKDNKEKGTTWQQEFSVNGGKNVFYYKIEEKDITVSIQGQAFSNVIRVSLTQTFEYPGFDTITMSVINFYFAKGVGLIKMTTEYDQSSGLGDFNGVSELESYEIK